MRSHWTRNLVAVLGVVALLSVAVVSSIVNRYQQWDEDPVSLANMTITAVVEVTIVDGPAKDEVFPTSELWTGTIAEVLWDRGTFTLVSGREANLGLPAAGEKIEISIPPHYKIGIGETYALGITRVYEDNPDDQAIWPWQYRVGLDKATGYGPIDGTPPEIAAELEVITFDGETKRDALVAVSAEMAGSLEARIAEAPQPETARLSVISEDRIAQNEQELADWYIGLTPEQRQLPQTSEDIPESALGAVGADSWESWKIVVLYDEKSAEGMASVGIRFDGVGFLGPYEMSSDETVIQIDGLGPVDVAGEFIWWPEGIPQEIVYKQEALTTSEKTRLVDASAKELAPAADSKGTPLIGGGIWLVDLRSGGNTVSSLTDDEYRKLFEELAPPNEDPGRSEPPPEG